MQFHVDDVHVIHRFISVLSDVNHFVATKVYTLHMCSIDWRYYSNTQWAQCNKKSRFGTFFFFFFNLCTLLYPNIKVTWRVLYSIRIFCYWSSLGSWLLSIPSCSTSCASVFNVLRFWGLQSLRLLSHIINRHRFY